MSDILYRRKAHGKLLLTGEYFVLDGTESLAIPTHYGQTLNVQSSDVFSWKSLDNDGKLWLSLLENDNPSTLNPSQQKLKDILKSISESLPLKKFCIQADFPLEWGLGSSSTLIALLSDYFRVNPYQLNHIMFQGSGYDIACAFASNPILYSNREDKYQPIVEEVHLSPSITDNLYFVYLGQKKNSREAITHYQNTISKSSALIDEISHLTRILISHQNLSEWVRILTIHDDLISHHLQIPKIQEAHLSQFPYFAKYLGAWGGDFAMIVADDSSENISAILSKLGYSTFFCYNEIIITN